MKKFLTLIPLLCACAPVISGSSDTTSNSAVLGPFKYGQTWVLASDSKTERLIPPKTLFTIEQIFPDRHTVIGKSALSSDKTPIQIEYTPEDSQLLVADISPISFGARKIRTCFFFGSAGQDGVYSGLAAHFNPAQTKIDPEAFKNLYLTTHPKATDQEIGLAFVQTLAPEDGGPCTLTLVK